MSRSNSRIRNSLRKSGFLLKNDLNGLSSVKGTIVLFVFSKILSFLFLTSLSKFSKYFNFFGSYFPPYIYSSIRNSNFPFFWRKFFNFCGILISGEEKYYVDNFIFYILLYKGVK